MVSGIGTDIIRIDRIAAALARHGDRFASKILGPQEMEKYLRRKQKVEARGVRFLATRFAAKEAFSKAIGLGMRMPMTWRLCEIAKLPSGQPVRLAESVKARVWVLDSAGNRVKSKNKITIPEGWYALPKD